MLFHSMFEFQTWSLNMKLSKAESLSFWVLEVEKKRVNKNTCGMQG